MTLAMILLSVASSGSRAAPPSAQRLSPSGKWVVAFDDDMCTAARQFGEGRDEITIVFRPFPTQQNMEVVVLEPGRGTEDSRRGRAQIAIDPGNVNATAFYESFGVGDHRLITHIHGERAWLTALAKASTITITIGNKTRTAMLTSTGFLMATLHRCEVQLLTNWGVDPALFFDADPPTPVEGNPGRWFGPDSYPVEAMHAREQGRVIALLAIDVTGQVTNCRVVTSSRSRSLDAATCEIAKRIRYTPSHDTGGKAIASWSILPVVWQLP
ncbi:MULTISPECIES: energy transducer TonB [unclassified Sphingomonas]|uniref:energy transducer TonB n=1 Tax=unclassified Sphingomonas TaxID=196159 RepID=UPI002269BA1E|nr:MULTISPECIES: energy transducer TonB [unclassified Sphingomonas]